MLSKTIKEIHQIIGGTLTLNTYQDNTIANGISYDSRNVDKDGIYVAIEGAKVDGHKFLDGAHKAGAVLAIISNIEYKESSLATICVQNVEEAIQELARVYREENDAKFIAITGSNGKTSCKDLVAGVLQIKGSTYKTQGNHNNELGVPFTLLHMDKENEFGVIEMGMENFEDIHLLNSMVHQDAAVITNIGAAHLANLGSLENIARAKLEIIDSLADNSLFIYFGDDATLNEVIKEKDVSNLRVKKFGFESTNDMYPTSIDINEDTIKFITNLSSFEFTLDMLGKHQILNAMVAILYAYDLGMKDEEIQQGFDSFEATSMRNEIVHLGNITVLDDSYKSNPQSALAAIETFEQMKADYKIIVLADMLDLGDDEKQFHYDLGASLIYNSYDELITYGELAKEIERGAKDVQPSKIYRHMNSHEEISEYLKSIKRPFSVLFKGSRGLALDKVVTALKGEEHE